MISPARIFVRLTDLDILGHVNNAIYLTYFEMARMHYFAEMVGTEWNWMEEGVVLALHDVATHAGLNWDQLGATLKKEGRLHLETY